MTINTNIDIDRKPRFEFNKNGSSIGVKARLNGSTIEFSLLRRKAGSKVYSARKGKAILLSTKAGNLEEAARIGAKKVAAKLNIAWESEEAIVSDTRFASCQAVIDAFEAAAEAGKIRTKTNEKLGAKSVRDYPAALRLILGLGQDQSIKGQADLSHVSVSKLGELTDEGTCKVFEQYRNRVLSDGNGGFLECGPSYEKKVATFNSNLKKAKALFSDRYRKAAYGKLNLDSKAVEVFRDYAKIGTAKKKGYTPPPINVILELDAKVSKLAKDTDFDQFDKDTDTVWNVVTLYRIARNSGLRLDELFHLSFNSFFESRKTIRNAETHEPKIVDVDVVAVRSTDPYENGKFKQGQWQAKGKVEREVTIPRFLLEWIREEQKRRGAKGDERILRGQEFSAKTVKENCRHYWNDELIYGTNAADYFKKNWHELRALYGCEIVTATGSLHKAQLALGHSSVQVTEQYYAHLLTDCVFVTNFGA